MKNIIKKIKIVIIIIISIFLISGISVYATYNYFSKNVSYTKKDGTEISVEDALNELYNSKSNKIYEVGEFNQYVEYASHYVTYTIKLKHTYLEEDNARLIITDITEPHAMYCNFDAIRNKVVGNTINITLLNYSDDIRCSKTYNVKYAIVRIDDL